jgi:tight adherence protein B
MVVVILAFVFGVAVVVGGFAAVAYIPGALARRRLDRRLKDVSAPVDEPAGDEALVMQRVESPLPGVDRLVAQTAAGSWLKKLIEQSGVRTTPGGLVLMTIAMGLGAAFVADLLTRQRLVPPFAGLVGAVGPIVVLMQRRGARLHSFEEHFPEALDLVSRALRAGHAFQTALGMVAQEMNAPIGPEFKKTFDHQNFGLPLKDALHDLTERVPLLDVRFFVTAVLIQRDTGGNLSEILDNLAHVVRERFKIRRQVRTHTAHGRFTAFVLIALPAALAVVLTMLSPDHMRPLFYNRMGQTALIVAIVMQIIGFLWIRKVIRIEV